MTSLKEAADHVLLHYNAYDYNGADISFLAYCEEISEGRDVEKEINQATRSSNA